MQNSILLIITGGRGAGKTTFCQHLLAAVQAMKIDVGGLLSPAVFHNGKKIGIDLINLKDGERRRLAEHADEHSDRVVEVRTRAWLFDSGNLEWGNEMLQFAVPCDLLVVDELGPLELEQERGWTNALTAIETCAYQLGLVVIRPELLEVAQQRWRHAITINIPPGINTEEFAKKIASGFFIN